MKLGKVSSGLIVVMAILFVLLNILFDRSPPTHDDVLLVSIQRKAETLYELCDKYKQTTGDVLTSLDGLYKIAEESDIYDLRRYRINEKDYMLQVIFNPKLSIQGNLGDGIRIIVDAKNKSQIVNNKD